MLAAAIAIFAASEIGFRLGLGKEAGASSTDPSWVVEASAFTLLALLTGFSFSMALGRYDARRGALLREATAIGTTFMRAALLDEKTAQALRADLREYVAQRLAFARADAAPDERAMADRNSTAIQGDMWKLTTQAARRDPRSTIVPLVVAALNDTINLSHEERVVLTTHIPDVVFVWLLLIGLIAAVMMGYGYGRQDKRALVFRAVFAAMVAMVLGLVLDLDRPQRGIIRVSLEPMQTVQQSMESGLWR
jgi:hypothetical protein